MFHFLKISSNFPKNFLQFSQNFLQIIIESFHSEKSVALELNSLIERRGLPFKIDKLTRGNGSCWMISVFQQCKRQEIYLYLQDDIRNLVDKMDTNGLRNAVCDFMLTSNHPKVKIFKARYQRLDGSELPWIELWGAGRKGMRNSTVWADQNFMQATAWLLGVEDFELSIHKWNDQLPPIFRKPRTRKCPFNCASNDYWV